MKKLLSLSTLSAFILLMMQAGVTSCTKEVIVRDTVTITKKDTLIKKDTVIIKDTAISLQLLTSKSWKLEEIRGVEGNTILYYKRGATGNTENFDIEYITFNANKTGIYFDAVGSTHQMTWDFANAENTKIIFIVQNPAPIPSQTVVYENLRYKNGALLFDEYWSYNNRNTHAQVIRIPR
jgi:hypothetical protein